MARTRTSAGGRPLGRPLVLLVLAVLTGVLGMHALAPGAVPAAHADAGHVMTAAHTTGEQRASIGCAHTEGGSGHLDHADGTCAAAGVGSAYTPPALPAALTEGPAASLLPGSASASAVSGRGPPDLSELQLLRI
ncbi:hypothetical protein SUDANB176_05775 [Streptomyces sp. enrichment culture]|uniref:DUF6153 family protein n=1 Tax=Streptomyces sp. enrichment culture TaxID=1795815 RepID=UPI003F565FEE